VSGQASGKGGASREGWLARRGELTDLLEIALNVRLEQERDLIAVRNATSFGVGGLLLGIRSADFLRARGNLDGDFTSEVELPAAEELGELAHSSQLLGFADILAAILLTDAAAALAGWLRIRAAASRFAGTAAGGLQGFGFLLAVAVERGIRC